MAIVLNRIVPCPSCSHRIAGKFCENFPRYLKFLAVIHQIVVIHLDVSHRQMTYISVGKQSNAVFFVKEQWRERRMGRGMNRFTADRGMNRQTARQSDG